MTSTFWLIQSLETFWKYKVHGEDMASTSQFSSTTPKIVAYEVPKLLNAQVKLEPHVVPQIVLDLSDGMDDDDVLMIPNPLVHMPCKDGHVLTIGESHVFPTSSQVDLTFFWGTPTPHKLCNFHYKLECHPRISCIVWTKNMMGTLGVQLKPPTLKNVYMYYKNPHSYRVACIAKIIDCVMHKKINVT